MRRNIFALVIALLCGVQFMYAQTGAENSSEGDTNVSLEEVASSVSKPKVSTTTEEVETSMGLHRVLTEKFIEGGPGFMSVILLALVLGLAFSIERILYIGLSSTNTKRLLSRIEAAVKEGDIEKAKEVCRATRGPIASICFQGLIRLDEGIDVVEKSVISYGGVQVGRLEGGLTWISLFIALAPMLGFLGTVIGMVQAFDAIQKAGEIDPTQVAGGIKVALLTTIFGLIAAIILQIFYNLCTSMIEGLTNKMEDASISFLDIIVRNNPKG